MNRTGRTSFIVIFVLFALALVAVAAVFDFEYKPKQPKLQRQIKNRQHLDHSRFFSEEFKSPQEVTKACLSCHPDSAKEIMRTSHWTWLSGQAELTRNGKSFKIGKKNLVNNFCLSIVGNWSACTRCHIGYGWKDESYDFSNEENVDCLICHDWTNTYIKGNAGIPQKGVDLLAVAKGVGYPKRENCGICHFFGGGGEGVKHGDLDPSLTNADDELDIHMGKHRMLCTDCHQTQNHQIMGKAHSTCNCPKTQDIGCIDCHDNNPHKDKRINEHYKAVACQTCHIPVFAKRIPTKMYWDWSKAGDKKRPEDPHAYLKKKGEFKYEQLARPEYYWFNLGINRYMMGDKIDPKKEVPINDIDGDISDKDAKIWPFKVHRAKQPYDKNEKFLLSPVTAGEGGYWREFDWHKAFRLGGEITGFKYSGAYGFVTTRMYWPLSHMVSAKDKALKCNDCHSKNGVLDWKALGYPGDPMVVGGRK
jgi:octaheme c-type cytochrome (tetrathionate reductase family)